MVPTLENMLKLFYFASQEKREREIEREREREGERKGDHFPQHMIYTKLLLKLPTQSVVHGPAASAPQRACVK